MFVSVGQSRCHRCGRKCEPQCELCIDCYRDGEPECKVMEAVFNYFSEPKFRENGFFSKKDKHEIRIGTYTPRPDVVLFDRQENLAAIAECKRSGITSYGIGQLKSYLTATDVQFGIFANSTEPDKWIFFENLRRYNFEEIPRVQFETKIVANRPIESIREEEDRLREKVCALSTQKDQLQSEIATKNQQRLCLLKKNNLLERDKDRLEKNRNKVKSELEALRKAHKKEKEDIEEQKRLRVYLKKINADLDERIKHKTSLIRELESKLGELEVIFAQKPIYGEIEEELKRLNELESEITRKQQAAGRYQEKCAAYEKNKVEIDEKIQQLAQVSEKRKSILKQLRVVVNRLKAANPEQGVQIEIEGHRKQLVQGLRKQESIFAQLTAEINQLKETRSRLETEVMEKTQQSPDEEKEMRPAYIQIQGQIDKLKAEKSKIETEIGHRIFLLLQ